MPVAVVTGAGGGIGRAISSRLRAAGWTVRGLDRAWPAERSADDLEADLSRVAEFQDLLRGMGPVDLLVNNAAQMSTTPIAGLDPAKVEELLRINVVAPLAAMQALQRVLADTGGSVVNISSVHAYATSAGAAPYAASKAALIALTRAAAIEFGPAVRVNAIAPGAIATPMLEEGLARDPALREFLIGRTPLGRVGEADDVAAAVEFLANPEGAGYITGQTLVIDGGVLSRLSSE